MQNGSLKPGNGKLLGILGMAKKLRNEHRLKQIEGQGFLTVWNVILSHMASFD